MNAAARTLSEGSLFRGGAGSLTLLRPWLSITLLTLLVLTSALSVVYLKNTERQLFSQLQQLKQQTTEQSVEWGRLLLEKSTWSAPSRVQRQARRTLSMARPEHYVIVSTH